MRRFFSAVSSLLIGIVSFIPMAFAVEAPHGIAVTVDIADPNAQDGDIIVTRDNTFALSAKPYEPLMYGVIAETNVAEFENTTLENGKPVLASGNVNVRVTAKNGAIAKGDFI